MEEFQNPPRTSSPAGFDPRNDSIVATQRFQSLLHKYLWELTPIPVIVIDAYNTGFCDLECGIGEWFNCDRGIDELPPSHMLPYFMEPVTSLRITVPILFASLQDRIMSEKDDAWIYLDGFSEYWRLEGNTESVRRFYGHLSYRQLVVLLLLARKVGVRFNEQDFPGVHNFTLLLREVIESDPR